MQACGQEGLQIQFSSAVWCTTLPTTSLGPVNVLRGQDNLDFSIPSFYGLHTEGSRGTCTAPEEQPDVYGVSPVCGHPVHRLLEGEGPLEVPITVHNPGAELPGLPRVSVQVFVTHLHIGGTASWLIHTISLTLLYCSTSEVKSLY